MARAQGEFTPYTPPGADLFTNRRPVKLSRESAANILGKTVANPDQLVIERERLVGKVAIITGSTQGIGEATARLFGELGMKVVLNGRPGEDGRSARGEEIAEEMSKTGVEAMCVAADVSQDEGAKKLVNEAVKKYGRIDVVVNNVGTTRDGLFIRMNEGQVYDVMAAKFNSALYVTKYALMQMAMRQSPPGGVFLYASSPAVEGFPGQANYAAANAAMEAIARTAARDFQVFEDPQNPSKSEKNIFVGIVRPGLTRTKLTEGLTESQQEAILKVSPGGRAFEARDIAKGFAYLAQFQGTDIRELNII